MKRILSVPILRLTRETLLFWWIAVLAASAAGMVIGLWEAGYRLERPVMVVILALLALAAEREGIRLTATVEVSVASLLCIFAAVVLGPLPAVVIGAVGLLADLPRRDAPQPVLRWITWTSIKVIVAGGAGLAAAALLSGGSTDFWRIFSAVVAAFTVETTIEVGLTFVAPAIRGTRAWTDGLKSVGPALLASVPLQAPVVTVLAYSYLSISPWSVALFAIPAVAAQRLLVLYREQRETSEALGVANERLEKANVSFATALVATLDARDRYTAGHSAAVAIYARDIARRMGLTEQEQEIVHLCGLVHDVGKIGLPPGLLEKPGALSLEERRHMEEHPVIGERILKNVDDYGEIARIVRHHHERLDGLGYPDGLRAAEIPLLSRVIAVADAYNAMTSDRPYRDAMPSRVARLRLAQAVESQFDTSVVAAFEALLAGGSEAYRLGKEPEFVLDTEGSSSAAEPHAVEMPAMMALPAALA